MFKSKERLYNVYLGMRHRCYDPKIKNYRLYGGRGIKICDEWLNDYSVFREWAYANGYDENAPRGKCTIDRIDNNGDYTPQNCRWVDMKTQRKNQNPLNMYQKNPELRTHKSKHMWTINGKTMSANWWCRHYGVGFSYVMYRVTKMGMAPLEALTLPKKQSGRPRKTGGD